MTPIIRPFRLTDALQTRQVFTDAVLIGAASRYTLAERRDWVPDPAMPKDWGQWLDRHITLVADDPPEITGFMMIERDGYLNMAFVRPERMGTGLADQLYTALLPLSPQIRLTTLASRFAQSFFLRHGWLYAPEIANMEGMDPDQSTPNPLNRPMALTR